MNKVFTFTGPVLFNQEDGGQALVSEQIIGDHEHLGVCIQSWDEDCVHEDAKLLAGKTVKVTVEILD